MTTESIQLQSRRIEASAGQKFFRKLSDHAMKYVVYATAAVVVASVVVIFVFLLKESLAFFKHRSVNSLVLGREWFPLEPSDTFGALPLICGTLLTTGIAIVLALPLGVLCAVFLGEIARGPVREFLKSTVEILAGIPSVVIGFIGLTMIGPWLADTLKLSTGLTALTGGVLLGMMALPTIISISEDALAAVPREYREASLGLGATRLQTIWKATLPAATRGVLAASMLGLGRAIGETMTVLMATGNAANIPNHLLAPVEDNGLFRSIRTLTATIAAEMGETPVGSLHYHALFALGLTLFVITLAVNSIADHALHRGKR